MLLKGRDWKTFLAEGEIASKNAEPRSRLSLNLIKEVIKTKANCEHIPYFRSMLSSQDFLSTFSKAQGLKSSSLLS